MGLDQRLRDPPLLLRQAPVPAASCTLLRSIYLEVTRRTQYDLDGDQAAAWPGSPTGQRRAGCSPTSGSASSSSATTATGTSGTSSACSGPPPPRACSMGARAGNLAYMYSPQLQGPPRPRPRHRGSPVVATSRRRRPAGSSPTFAGRGGVVQVPAAGDRVEQGHRAHDPHAGTCGASPSCGSSGADRPADRVAAGAGGVVVLASGRVALASRTSTTSSPTCCPAPGR